MSVGTVYFLLSHGLFDDSLNSSDNTETNDNFKGEQ